MQRSQFRDHPDRFRPRIGMSWFVGLVGAGWWVASSAWSQLPSTQLTALSPPGGKIGTTLEVRTLGADQEEGTNLLFSHPGITATPRLTAATEFEPSRPQPSQFNVQIGKDVIPGIYEARVVGRFGVSNPRCFVVGTRDEVKEAAGLNQPTGAMPLELDKTVNGIVDNSQAEYFKLSLNAGQRVLLECDAQRIDSRLSGSLVVFGSDGKEILRTRGANGGDPLLDFTAPRDGDYRVALHDFTYRGGAEYFYRLTAHSGPYLDFVMPPSGLPGSKGNYLIYGRNLPGGERVEGLTVNGAPLEKVQVEITLPDGDRAGRSFDLNQSVSSTGAYLDGVPYRMGNSNPLTIYIARGPVVLETSSSNDQPAQAQQLNVPCEVAGQFFPAHDVDYFAFQAKKGDIFDIEVLSHQLGQPTDPILIVTKVQRDEKGTESAKEIARVDDPADRNNRIGGAFDTSTDDPDYRLTADEDAEYRIMVSDQFGASRSDPRMIYRLAIHRGEPDFRLVAVPQPLIAPANENVVALAGVSVRRGGSSLIEVQLNRRYGFAGDVEVSVEGLPAGVICPPILIAAGARSGSLVATAAEDASAWAGTIRIAGKATVGERELIRHARSGIAVWNTANRQLESVPYRVTQDLAFGVIDRDTQPVLVQVAEDKVWETSRGGKLEIPIRVTRRANYKEELNFAALDIPAELKPPNLTVKAGENEGKVLLAATNGNAKPGLYTFYLRADSKVSHERNPHAVSANEQQQKEISATIAQLTERHKQADEAKGNAPKLAQEAANTVRVAEQEVSAAEKAVVEAVDYIQVVSSALAATKEAASKEGQNKPLADAVSIVDKAKAAAESAKVAAEQRVVEARRGVERANAGVQATKEAAAAAEKTASETDAKIKAAQQAKATVDKRLEEAKTANKPKVVPFAVVSSPIKVRIVETCVELKVLAPAAPAAPGDKLELPVQITRKYGFDDQLEITLELPKDAKGLTAGKLVIPKDQTEGKLAIAVSADAPAGEVQATFRARGRFNNIEVLAAQPVKLQIEKK